MTLRLPLTVALLTSALGVHTTHAQARFDMRLGVMASSNLVTDSIGTDPVTLRQNLAPTLALTIDSRVDVHTRLGITAAVARSNLMVHTPTDTRALLVLTTWTPMLVLTHDLTSALAVSGNAGVILYDPDIRLGTIFSDDAPAKPIVGVSLHWRRPLGASTAVGLDLSYDVHGFMTQTLLSQGFSGQWVVHRATLGVTLGYRADVPSP